MVFSALAGLFCLFGFPADAGDGVGDEVREALAGVAEGHPRLFVRSGDLAALRERVLVEPVTARLAQAVIAQADSWSDAAPLQRSLQGRRMLRVSREAVRRLVSLSMAWHLTGDRRYVDRAVRDLAAVAAFQDWNPGHFLDTAEMTFAVAVAYDWLHDELDEETRAMARRAILEKGLAPALSSDRHWWITAVNNWNQVCHGGLVAGALAVHDHHPEEARRILERAVRNLPRALEAYAPEGAYPEGPGYWAYGTTYNVLLLAMFDSALGTRFGLDEASGFDRTGSFPALITGPSGLTFNYADGRPGRSLQPAIYWLSRHFGEPGWAAMEDRWLDDAGFERVADNWLLSFALLWRDQPSTAGHDLPQHWLSGGKVPVALHRESWQRADSLFVGFKAGSPSAPHGQMDIGSFVLDADGVRWAHHLGAEDYHRIESRNMGLWEPGQDSDRWQVFRQNNLSHNTLVIDGQLQRAAGHAPVVRFSAEADFPHSVADMTTVYAGQAESVHRGIALLPEGAVLVRDRLTGLKTGSEVRWGMVTMATPALGSGADLELRQDGMGLDLSVLGRPDARWRQIETATPANEWDSPNPGTVMVAFTAVAPANGVVDLAVLIRPSSREEPELGDRHLAPPLEWSSSQGGTYQTPAL